MRAAVLENSFASCVITLSRRHEELAEFCRSSIILNLFCSKVLGKISDCVSLACGKLSVFVIALVIPTSSVLYRTMSVIPVDENV